MKESKFYIQFFKSNYFIILGFIFIFFIFGSLYYLNQPNFLKANSLFLITKKVEASEKIIIADQAVSLLREQTIQRMLDINKDSEITIYKPGPFIISLTAKSLQEDSLNLSLKKVEDFLIQEFEVFKVGETIYTRESSSYILILLIILILGLSTGVFVSLIKEYFQKF